MSRERFCIDIDLLQLAPKLDLSLHALWFNDLRFWRALEDWYLWHLDRLCFIQERVRNVTRSSRRSIFAMKEFLNTEESGMLGLILHQLWIMWDFRLVVSLVELPPMCGISWRRACESDLVSADKRRSFSAEQAFGPGMELQRTWRRWQLTHPPWRHLAAEDGLQKQRVLVYLITTSFAFRHTSDFMLVSVNFFFQL